MAQSWRKTASRFSQMSLHELQTRVGQEVRKRLDVALWRSGLMTGYRGVRHSQEKAGNFFFSPQEPPRLAQLLKDWLPAEASKIIDEADRILQHRISLLGYDTLAFGAEIDWHLDPVHGKRAPLQPWFEVDFLNFEHVGDHKVIWELNRHQHLVILAKAWCLTQDRSYLTELMSQWYSWREANPYPIGINWGSSLEVAFRSLSWIWIHHLILNCAARPTQFEVDLLHGLSTAGRHIDHYLSTYFSPNTHLLGEAVALFFIGSLYPQIGAARRWRDKSWQILLQESEHQVRSDGGYFEQALYYHVYALDFFLHARELACRNALEIPPSFDRTILKMLEFLCALCQGGIPLSFGDDDGGRVFNPRRNKAEHMSDPLSIGALSLQQSDLLSSAVLTEEAIWLFGDRAISLLARKPEVSMPVSRSFEASGIFLMADTASRTQCLMIDAGPQGTGRSGHGHADALSIQLSLNGRPWLIDSGTGCYMCQDGVRDQFRGTAAHNTLRVDNQDQAIAEGPFSWTCLPIVEIERWTQADSFNLFAAKHSGYARLPDPVFHRRFIFQLPGGFWLIRDLAEGQRQHLLEIFWHFHPELMINNLAETFVVANTKYDSQVPASKLALVPLRDEPWKIQQIGTQFAPAYGRFESAQAIRCQAQITLPAEYAVVITPLSSDADVGHLARIPTTSATTMLRYHDREATHFVVFALTTGEWTAGPWSSDACFVYYCVKQDRVTRFIACDASFADVGTNRFFAHPGKLSWMDWKHSVGGRSIFTSEDNQVEFLSEDVLASFLRSGK